MSNDNHDEHGRLSSGEGASEKSKAQKTMKAHAAAQSAILRKSFFQKRQAAAAHAVAKAHGFRRK